MRTKNCSADQDSILTDCESFGGRALEAAEIAQELDTALTEALDKINELEKETNK